jgi:hypothetical protein
MRLIYRFKRVESSGSYFWFYSHIGVDAFFTWPWLMSEPVQKEEASEQARRLREYLCKKYGEIGIAACMQAVAFIHGFKSWYHLLNGIVDNPRDELGDTTKTREN